jgi:chromosome partitioning protein
VEDWQKFKAKTGTIASMYKRFLEKIALDTKRFIWQSPIRVRGIYRIEGLDLIPCDIDLIGEDLAGSYVSGAFPNMEFLRKNAQTFLRDHSFLRTLIREVESDYDYILIDCPPNLYLMAQNALVASDYYVITAIPDHLSTIGLSILRQKVDRIGKVLESAHTLAGNTKMKSTVARLGGVVFVKVRIGGSLITGAHQAKMAEVQGYLGKQACFERYTTELIGYSEAAEASVPVWAHDSPNARRAAGKGEYQAITEEFMKRF